MSFQLPLLGLAIVIAYFRNRQTVDTRDIKAMRN